LSNLTPTRDSNHVTDTVGGFVLADAQSEAIGRTINLGFRREISIGDVVELITRLVGQPTDIRSEEQRVRAEKSEVNRLLADNALGSYGVGLGACHQSRRGI